jgi:hypothetical protein
MTATYRVGVRGRLKAHKQFIDWPKPTDTLVLENYVTNYLSLGPVIDDYNRALSESEKKVHGR